MKKLSLMDNGFLMAESAQAPFHVAGLLVFKLPKGARQKPFYRKIIKKFGEMAAVTPPFNQRLQLPPFNLGLPGWIKDEGIDLAYHIRHSALPDPGTMEGLKKLVSRLHSTLLDRTRPLWEAHLIEGIKGRQFALYFKIHHACIDGVGSMNMIKAIMSTSPEAEIAASISGTSSEKDDNARRFSIGSSPLTFSAVRAFASSFACSTVVSGNRPIRTRWGWPFTFAYQ